MEIKLPHSKSQIYGIACGYNTVFWWFGDNQILYHYKTTIYSYTETQYIELPKGVTKEKYRISGYSDRKKSLILIAL